MKDAIQIVIGHPHRTIRADANATGLLEHFLAEGHEKITVRRKLLHSLVAHIGHVDESLLIHRHIKGLVELPRLTTQPAPNLHIVQAACARSHKSSRKQSK